MATSSPSKMNTRHSPATSINIPSPSTPSTPSLQTGKIVTRMPTPKKNTAANVLSRDNLYFAPGQFDSEDVQLLTRDVEALSATVVFTPAEATAIITNPLSPAYKSLSHTAQDVAEVPYHWIAQCRIASTRLDPASELDPSLPYMVHPALERANGPLRVWVSVNIRRTGNESAEDANETVQNQLAAAGAVLVGKRSRADVLVVDTKSGFFRTILAEKESKGRDWQKIAERPWVETCIDEGVLKWASKHDGMMEDGVKDKGPEFIKRKRPARMEREDSFAEEEDQSKYLRGPGRPAGKPRVDYTPQDDDLMCRYLAAFYPQGSWLSRKTYGVMVNDVNRFPFVGRHSQQSWHERFKKNATAFTKRVNKYIGAGIDEDLKTTADHDRTQNLSQRIPSSPQRADESAMDNPAIGSKRKRAALVSGDSDDEDVTANAQSTAVNAHGGQMDVAPHPQQRGRQGVVSASLTERQQEVIRSGGNRVPSSTVVLPTIGHAMADSEAGSSSRINLDNSTERPQSQGANPSEAGIKATIALEPNPEPQTSADVEITSDQGDLESQDDQFETAPEATGPALHAKEASPQSGSVGGVEAAAAVVIEQSAVDKLASPSRTVVRVSPARDHGATRFITPPRTGAVPASAPPTIALGQRAPDSVSRQPARPRSSEPQTMPSTTSSKFARTSASPGRPSRYSPGAQAQNARAISRTSPAATHPSIGAEDNTSSSRRLQRSPEREAKEQQSKPLETVRTSLAPPSVPGMASRPPAPETEGQRRALVSHERTERVAQGQQLVNSVRDQYRARIHGYSTKYSVKPTEIVAIVHELSRGGGAQASRTKSAGAALFWQDVEALLRTKFGF